MKTIIFILLLPVLIGFSGNKCKPEPSPSPVPTETPILSNAL